MGEKSYHAQNLDVSHDPSQEFIPTLCSGQALSVAKNWGHRSTRQLWEIMLLTIQANICSLKNQTDPTRIIR